MTADQILSEQGVALARMVVAAFATSDERMTELAQKKALAQATDILDFDQARRAVVIEGPWKLRTAPNPDQPQGAA